MKIICTNKAKKTMTFSFHDNSSAAGSTLFERNLLVKKPSKIMSATIDLVFQASEIYIVLDVLLCCVTE